MVADQARTERAEQTAWLVQLNNDFHKYKGKLDSSERRNSIVDL